MTHPMKKLLFVLFLTASAFGCADPYSHHRYRNNYYPGSYSGGYGYGYERGSYTPYATPSPYYRQGRPWGGEQHHHHDSDHDGD